MAFPILVEIAFIPIKADAACQGAIGHPVSILQKYTRIKVCGAPNGWWLSGESAARVRCTRGLGRMLTRGLSSRPHRD